MTKRMNFLLFMPETLRADATGCFGNRVVRTPFTDQLASEGIAFRRAFVQHTVCTPSRCSMFTGWYPHTNGHRTLTYLLQPHERSLFRDLKEAGYYVQAFGKNDLLAQESILLNFDSVELKVKPQSPPVQNPWPRVHKYHKTFYFGEMPPEHVKDRDWACIESACRFLSEPPREPFCLYLPLGICHPPYRVEEPYFSMYSPSEVEPPIPANFENKREFMRLLHKAHEIDKLDEEDLRRIKATYYGMVTKLDAMLGKVLEKLKEASLYDNTAIFFFSDHGDYTGDYGLVEKWWTGFQDCLINVPLIARIPGVTPAGINDALIEMVDLYPTILELAGVEPRHTHFGVSLVPLIKGKGQGIRDAVFAEGGHRPGEEHCFEKPWPDGIYHEKTMLPRKHSPKVFAKSLMIRTEEFKYIYCPGDTDELYDLRKDPKEVMNIAGDPEAKPVVDRLKERILRWMLETADAVPFEWDERGF